jgi:hypothetical protein
MNSYATLLFPDTDIFSEKRYPLLLFFAPLYFLQLVEPRAGAKSDVNNETNLFLHRGLIEAHNPAPLGADRQQFLRLFDDITKRKEHYVAQLGVMTTGSKTASADAGTADQKHGIVSSLLREYGIMQQDPETNLELWQARLVLAIAEMLVSEEDALREELSEQLAFYNEEEIAALRSLQAAKGINEDEFFNELESIRAQLEKPRLSDTLKRFEAWLRLMKNQPLPPVKVWLASSRASAEHVFNRYESIRKTGAIPLLKLAFPAYIDASVKYVVQQIEEFQQATAAIHQGLVADFERVAKTVPYVHDSHESLLPYGTDWAGEWEGMLDVYFPASKDGRKNITFYLLPDQPLTRILSLPESVGASHQQAAHGLLGILGPS